MEPADVVPESSWSSLNSTLPAEESEILTRLLGSCHIPTEHDPHEPSFGNPSMSWSSDHVSDFYYCLDGVNAGTDSSQCYWRQGDDGSINTGSFFIPPACKCCYLNGSNEVPGINEINASSAPMDYFMEGGQQTTTSFRAVPNPPNVDPISLGYCSMNPSESIIPDPVSQTKRKFRMQKDDSPAESSKKKVRASAQIRKN